MVTQILVAPGHSVRADGESYATFTPEDIAKDKAMFEGMGMVQVPQENFQAWVIAQMVAKGQKENDITFGQYKEFVAITSENGVVAVADYGDGNGDLYFLPVDLEGKHDL